VPEQVGYILEEDALGTVGVQDSQDLGEEITVSVTTQAELLSSLREGLAWEAGAKNVMRRNVPEFQIADVPDRVHA